MKFESKQNQNQINLFVYNVSFVKDKLIFCEIWYCFWSNIPFNGFCFLIDIAF